MTARQGVVHRLKYFVLGLVILVFVGVASSLSAQGAASIAQGFQASDTNIVNGAIVSLKSGTPNTVELATTDNVSRLVGVAGNNSLIELTNGSSTIHVVTSGSTPTLVSDINGPIKAGDKITASPLAGVGMKVTESILIVGVAQANLDTSTAETRTVTDKQGHKQSVHVAAIPVQVDKVFYEAPVGLDSFLPPGLQNVAQSIAGGRQVSSIRVAAAASLLFVGLIIVVVLLYSAVRSSIISIGRNPLSQSAVRKSLFQVGLTIVGILVLSGLAVYLILTL